MSDSVYNYNHGATHRARTSRAPSCRHDAVARQRVCQRVDIGAVWLSQRGEGRKNAVDWGGGKRGNEREDEKDAEERGRGERGGLEGAGR